jgi:hypothetical protein
MVELLKGQTIQSAGMEDGLIDLIVIQLLVRMLKEQGLPLCRVPDHTCSAIEIQDILFRDSTDNAY